MAVVRGAGPHSTLFALGPGSTGPCHNLVRSLQLAYPCSLSFFLILILICLPNALLSVADTIDTMNPEILQNSPNPERETISEAEALLSRFSSLSDIEQDRERATYVSTIFPLLFGKDSVVQGSNGYESQRQAPWYVLIYYML